MPPMFRISGIVILGVASSALFGGPASAQAPSAADSSPTPEAAREILASAEQYDDSAVGDDGGKTDVYRAFEVLRETASRDELLRLFEHPNPVMALYAMQALVERFPEEPVFPLVLEALGDHRPVVTQSGCIVVADPVFADVLLDRYAETFALSERETLVQRLLAKGCKLSYRHRVLLHWNLAPDHVARVREWADEDPAALVALARFRTVEDLAIIRRALADPEARYYALWAVSEFPHPDLFPDLVALLDTILSSRHTATKRMFYEALVRYPNPEVDPILAAPLEDDFRGVMRRDAMELAFGVASKSPTLRFVDLYYRYWLEEGMLTESTLELLVSQDGPRAAAAAVASFEAGRYGVCCKGRLLDLIYAGSPRDGARLLNASLARANVHDFPAFASYAAQRLERSALPVLQERLLDRNPHIYLAAAKAILDFGDSRAEIELRDAFDSHSHLRTGWGGESLAKLLGL